MIGMGAQAEGAQHPPVRRPLPVRVGWEGPGPSSEKLREML